MKAWDIVVEVENKPGMLWKAANCLGDAGVNVEGFCTTEHNGSGWVHWCVQDNAAARRAFESAGWKVVSEKECWWAEMDNEPGSLAEWCKWISDAGINIEWAYMGANNSVCLVTDNWAKVSEVWKEKAAV